MKPGFSPPQRSFVGKTNQAGENHRVSAGFGGMKKDQHRERFSFNRVRSLIETGVARVAVSVGPRAQRRATETHRVARSHKTGEPTSVDLCWWVAKRSASGASEYVEAR